MRPLLLTIFISLSFSAFSQNYADKERYLIDSLDYESLHPEYQKFIDYCIDYYHTTDVELYKVSMLYEIVRNIWDDKITSQYNRIVYDMSTEKLKEKGLADSLVNWYGRFQAGSIYYFAWGHFYRTEYDQTISKFQESQRLYEHYGDSAGAANCIDNIGSVYSTKGEMAKALSYHKRALDIREIIQDTMGLGASYNAIGIIHMQHGDYFQAIEDFNKAIEYHYAVQWWSGLSNEYSNIGVVAQQLGYDSLALDYHLESYRIKEEIGDAQGMSISLANIAGLAHLAGDTTSAFEYQNYGLQISQELGDQIGIARSLSTLGYFHALQDEYEEAKEHLLKSKEIAEEIGAYTVLRSSLQHLFLTHMWEDDFKGAEEYMHQLIDMRKNDIKVNFAVLPEAKKELYLNTMAEEYRNLYGYGNVRLEKNPEITTYLYDNTLLLKGLLLHSSTAMREAILGSNDSVLIAEYESWTNLKIEIADRYAKAFETDSLEKIANEMEQSLVMKSAAFDKFHNSKEASWKDVQGKLENNEAAIEFIYYPQIINNPASPMIYGALVLKADSKYPEMIRLCMEEDLENLIGKASANNYGYVNELYGTKTNQKEDLSELIWEPLKVALKGTEKIYFAPVGLLHKVAFSAISTGEGNLLCDKFELVQMSSTIEILAEDNLEFATNQEATLFGGVTYSTDVSDHVIWDYLPGSKKEIDSIQNIIKENIRINYYQGLNASEQNFKQIANSSNILHIASHGFFYPDPEVVRQETQKDMEEGDLEFRGSSLGSTNYGIWNFVNNENPLMRSGIALAGANDAWERDVFAEGEDGVLSAQEVSNLNMTNTDLVVLSACETGLGDIKGSEGVYGLQRAFKMAGVRYLIMSLWQVPDAETAEFMTQFYKNLFEDKDIRTAFKKAQDAMRSKYDPYFWAAFVLIE